MKNNNLVSIIHKYFAPETQVDHQLLFNSTISQEDFSKTKIRFLLIENQGLWLPAC